jgi:hypothetical protein
MACSHPPRAWSSCARHLQPPCARCSHWSRVPAPAPPGPVELLAHPEGGQPVMTRSTGRLLCFRVKCRSGALRGRWPVVFLWRPVAAGCDHVHRFGWLVASRPARMRRVPQERGTRRHPRILSRPPTASVPTEQHAGRAMLPWSVPTKPARVCILNSGMERISDVGALLSCFQEE